DQGARHDGAGQTDRLGAVGGEIDFIHCVVVNGARTQAAGHQPAGGNESHQACNQQAQSTTAQGPTPPPTISMVPSICPGSPASRPGSWDPPPGRRRSPGRPRTNWWANLLDDTPRKLRILCPLKC